MAPIWAYSAQPPSAMIENIDALATLKAPIKVCKLSNEYQSLEIQKKLKYINLEIDIDSFALKISNYYKDAILFEFYLRNVNKYSDLYESKGSLIRKYGSQCSEGMIREIEKSFRDSSKELNKYIK
jgi:hypothetical protein